MKQVILAAAIDGAVGHEVNIAMDPFLGILQSGRARNDR
jgi:hypothetical protein